MFFSQSSNNSDSTVFKNAHFWEIKDHSWMMTPFQELFLLWKFLCVYLTQKGIFRCNSETLFFMAQITQIFLFLEMLVLEISKITDSQ